jgi:hypothetical protein
MATSTYLSNPVVTIGVVDLTNQCTSATLTRRVDQLEATAFTDLNRKFVAGLGNHELALSLYMSYDANETYATLQSLVGTALNVRVQPAAPPDSATNPGFILTGTFLAELPVINATMGELSTIDITFSGGVYSVDVA